MTDPGELEVPPSPGGELRSGAKTTGGIVRKRSVRRCISTGKEESIPLTYGRHRDEYEKIVERVLTDKSVQGAVETLRERWKMILIMYDDCMELVHDWEQLQLQKAQKIDWFQLLITIIVSISVLIPVVCIVYKWG